MMEGFLMTWALWIAIAVSILMLTLVTVGISAGVIYGGVVAYRFIKGRYRGGNHD